MNHRPIVAVSSVFPLDLRDALGARWELRQPASGRWTRELLRAHIGDARAAIVTLRDAIDEDLLRAAPDLRIVANCAVGTDNVDLACASRRGILVTNTPDVLTEATADFTFALLLAVARRLPEGDQWARSGTWTGWEPTQLLGASVHGRTLGIIGPGRIGRAVARRARGFEMEVLYTTRDSVADPAAAGARVSFDELLARSDFITLHCPLTPESHHIIDRDALGKMKPSAFLINTARGACVDEGALCQALEDREIAGAGLDVFEREPEISSFLRGCQRVVLAPHAGSATIDTRRRMAQICVDAVEHELAGRLPPTAVNPQVYSAGQPT